MANDKVQKLPRSPGEMERLTYDKECQFMRNAFYELASMADEVEIELEKRDDDCECDDSDGDWKVWARAGGKVFEAKHERIVNALWFVVTHLTAKSREEFETWQKKRANALAKLTIEEQRLLRLRHDGE